MPSVTPASLLVAVLGDEDVQARDETADTESGECPEHDQLFEIHRRRGQSHSYGHENEARDGAAAPSDAVRQRRQEEGADGHSDQAGAEQITDLDGARPPHSLLRCGATNAMMRISKPSTMHSRKQITIVRI